MAKKFATPIDLLQNEFRNVRIQNLASAPSSPVEGQIYYNSTTKLFGFWNGTAWVYSSTITIDTDGTLSANSDAVVPSQKAVKAYADTKQSALGFTPENVANKDTDGTFAANSDTKYPSQKAVKTYVDGKVLNSTHLQGGIDCSANPNYPAAAVGDAYRVSVAGKIGGGSGPDVNVGDEILCYTASSTGNHATVGSNWIILESNRDQATTSLLGLVILASSSDAEAKSSTTKAVTPSALTHFAKMYHFTATGDNSTTDFECTHNFNTRDVIVRVRQVQSPYAEIIVDDEATTVNKVTVKFATAPAAGVDYTISVAAL
jgi:hypothetical protein